MIGSSGIESGILASNFCYDASNRMVEGLARERIRLGLPCTILNMAGLQDVGSVASNDQCKSMLRTTGLELPPSRRAIMDLENAVARGHNNILQCQFAYHDPVKMIQPYMPCSSQKCIVFGSHGNESSTGDSWLNPGTDLFGYLHGALVGLEICCIMAKDYGTIPHTFIPVRVDAPHVKIRDPWVWKLKRKIRHVFFNREKYQLPVDKVTKFVKQQYTSKAEGATSTLFDHKTAFKMLPRLTDVEAYRDMMRRRFREAQYSPKAPYVLTSMPINACLGINDRSADCRNEAMENWKYYTEGPVRLHTWYGDHFFPFDSSVSTHFGDTVESLVSG
eukprot:jgi/Picsp_1/6353/NSC_03702-R1_---NA---